MDAQRSRLPFWGLMLALAWAPWPLASNRPWSLALLALLVWLPLVGLVVHRLVAGARPGPHAAPASLALPPGAWLPTACLAGFAALAALQLVPGLGPQGGAVSIDPFATRHHLLTTAVYAGAWLLVLLAVQSQRRLRWLLLGVVACGVVQACVAVALHAARVRYTLFDTTFEQGARVSGTFANPDHFAGYMELCLSAAVGWLLAGFAVQSTERDPGWRGKLVGALHFALSPRMLVRVLMVVMVIALVMTHSRMGNGAFFITLLVGGGLIAAISLPMRKPALWLVASMAVIDIVVIGQWVGLDRVAERISDTVQASVPMAADADALGLTPAPKREESLAERLTAPTLALALVRERPWLGHGGGTFATAFPPHKRPGLSQHWDHAHNDYVQVAADMGLPGLLLWLGVGMASAWRAAQLLRQRQSPEALGIGAAVLLACISLGLHTMVDFNLHIPANALTFTVLLAAVWAVPRPHRRSSRHAGRSAGPQPE